MSDGGARRAAPDQNPDPVPAEFHVPNIQTSCGSMSGGRKNVVKNPRCVGHSPRTGELAGDRAEGKTSQNPAARVVAPAARIYAAGEMARQPRRALASLCVKGGRKFRASEKG